MKKSRVIIRIIVAVLVIMVIGSIFINYNKNKNKNVDTPKPDEAEVDDFKKGSFTIDDYTINIDSSEKGRLQPGSYFSTHFTIINNEKTESNYIIHFSDIIDSNTTPYDSDFETNEKGSVSIDGKEYKYYIDKSSWNAIICYTIPGENKSLIIKILGSYVFDSSGNQAKHLAHIDKEMLNSKELAGVLNYTITK